MPDATAQSATATMTSVPPSASSQLDPTLISLVQKRLKNEKLYTILADLETMGLDEPRLQRLADIFQDGLRRTPTVAGIARPVYLSPAVFERLWFCIVMLFALSAFSFISSGFMVSRSAGVAVISISSLLIAACARTALFIAEGYLLYLLLGFTSHRSASFTRTLWYFNFVALMLFFMNFFIYGLGLLHTELGSAILYFCVFVLSVPFFIFFFDQNFFHATITALLFLFLNGAFYFVLHFLNAQLFGARVLEMFLSVL